MKLFLAIGAFALLAGCARFQPRPLSPSASAAGLENRSLQDPVFRAFLEKHLQREFTNWPASTWDFEMLTLAAYYFHPSLDVARAQWAVAKGGQITAGQRPNPVLTVTPGYDVTTLVPSPWIPLSFLDIPLETAGKRGYRIAEATQLSEAARLNLAAVAWQTRGNVRVSVLDFLAASQREKRLEAQVNLQEQIVGLLEQQIKAGAIAGSEALSFRIALIKARLDLADARRQEIEARTRIAEAVGIPVHALDGITIDFDLGRRPDSANELTSTEARRVALESRSDILAGLAQYAAAEGDLRLQIARQYPDVHLQPGYQFDQGDSKWTLGLVVELPILSHNQGLIAEAEARREEAAARFNALQAKVLADIERAVELFRTDVTNYSALHALVEAQGKRRDAIEAQLKAGSAERLDLLNVQFEYAAAELAEFDSQIKLQQAIGALEDTLQRPMPTAFPIYQSERPHAP